MLVAGLTGGIATGKSTVSGMFRAAGAEIVDADQIAREVVQRGQPAWRKIKAHFGEEILLADQEINRELLGDIIFGDPARKKALNEIVHPFVFEKMEADIGRAEATRPDGIVILDVPLLIETGMHQGLPELILVYIPERMQLERLIARDHISEASARARIQSQMPIEEKKQYAGILIDNSKGVEKTKVRVSEVLQLLQEKERAQKKDSSFSLVHLP